MLRRNRSHIFASARFVLARLIVASGPHARDRSPESWHGRAWNVARGRSIGALLLACLIPLISPTLALTQNVPDSIVAEGVPAVPQSLVDQLNRYQQTRSGLFQGWLGDRREILILTRFADTNQVHRVAFPGGVRTQLTFLNERVLGVAPQPWREQFAYVTDEGGAENYQLFHDEIQSGTVTRLTDGRSRNTMGRWSNAGKLLAWSSNARNGVEMDLYVVDPSDLQSARRFKEVSGTWTVSDWSPDDRQVVAIEYVSINESYVHVIEVESGRTETITPRSKGEAAPVAYADARFSTDGKAIYWTTDLDSEFRRLARFDLASKTQKPITGEIPWDVIGFDLADDGKTVAFVTNEDGLDKIHVIDAETGRERPGPRLPAGQIAGLAFRRKTVEFGFSISSAHSPADAYSYDLATGQLARWTQSETGGLAPESFVEPALIHYKTFDDREIPAFVYRPTSDGKFKPPYPVLIEIHGGPENQFRPGFLGGANYYLNELGIALVFPNVRGSSGYGKSYLKLDNGLRREDPVKDIGALLDWIAKQPGLDASRVAVAGGSYGGFMSLATMTHYSDRLKAGIDIVGISSFLSMLQNTQGYRRDLRRAEYGDERDPKMREFLEQVSPLTSAAKIKVPILVVAGQNDPRVPVTESEQVVAAVRQNDVPLWYVVGKNEGHGFAKKKNVDYLQFARAMFLKKYLLGEDF
jgi:dipeptidyl aminopeptidase/acylaminoacyl peptidase